MQCSAACSSTRLELRLRRQSSPRRTLAAAALTAATGVQYDHSESNWVGTNDTQGDEESGDTVRIPGHSPVKHSGHAKHTEPRIQQADASSKGRSASIPEHLPAIRRPTSLWTRT